LGTAVQETGLGCSGTSLSHSVREDGYSIASSHSESVKGLESDFFTFQTSTLTNKQ